MKVSLFKEMVGTATHQKARVLKMGPDERLQGGRGGAVVVMCNFEEMRSAEMVADGSIQVLLGNDRRRVIRTIIWALRR